MLLLISNHDNEKVYFTKLVRKIKYLYPAQKHIHVKILIDTVENHELSKPGIFSQNGHPVNSNS